MSAQVQAISIPRTPRAEPTLCPWAPKLARLMDSRFRVPGTEIRFGLDPIIGLLPIAGDTITLGIGLAMISEAKRLGLGTRVMAKMVGNLAIDWLAGLVPGIDLVLDTAVKAHTRNAELIARTLQRRSPHG